MPFEVLVVGVVPLCAGYVGLTRWADGVIWCGRWVARADPGAGDLR
jgi:hypothetical protein